MEEKKTSALSRLFTLATPVAITYFIETLFSMVPLFFLGRLGTPENMAAAALANLYMNCSGYCFFYGVAGAIDTLGSQAYGAGKNFTVGLVTQRTILLLLLLCIIVVPVWIFGDQFLFILGQPPKICELAKLYIYWRLPAVFPLLTYECLKKFLSCRGKTTPCAVTSFICLCVNILSCYLLIDVYQWGFIGAPIAWTIANFLNLFLLVAYILLFDDAATYMPRPSCELFTNWGEVVTLGLQGAIQLALEWASYEVSAIISGTVGVNMVKDNIIPLTQEADPLAAHTIIANSIGFFFMVPLSFGIASSILVGNALGNHDAKGAKENAFICLKVNFVWTLIAMTIILLSRNVWGYIFTNDEHVVELYANAAIYCAFFVLFDGTQCQLAYILRGCALQKYGAIANAISYPLIGLPAAFGLGIYWFKSIDGVWLGMAIGNLASVIILSIAFFMIKWEEQADKAVTRVNDQEGGLASQEERGEIEKLDELLLPQGLNNYESLAG